MSELRRRNVFMMAVLYVVVAWLVMQVADVFKDLANLPDWIGPAILGLLAVGFPIALVFSWFYELTPEGLALEKDVDRAESITHITGRRLNFIVLSLLCAAVILFAYDKWWIGPPPELSIAILPFENMSPEKDIVGFLAVGIQDDLLTRLSKIRALKVISRTSVGRYQNTTMSIRSIGEELGVSKILEGGVQGVGDQIRVNVQLIDTATDDHLWAETYDRSLTATNIFEMQSEIVQTIAQQLNANLTDKETRELAGMPTRDLAAYTAYLQGMVKADIESVESMNAAIEDFNAAISLDPDFALAYVGLADAYLTLNRFYGGLPTDESTALAEPPLVRALELNRSLGEAYATLGLLRQIQGNLQAAEAAYKQAISLQPNYPRVFRLYGQLRWNQDEYDEALELLHEAMVLDPYSAPVNYDLARILDVTGRFEEALTKYLRVVEIEPKHAFAYVHIAAIHYLVFGRADEALIWYQKASDNDALSPSLMSVQALAYLEIGDSESAKEWVDRGLQLGPKTFWPLWTSLLHNIYTGRETAAQADARTLLEVYPQNWGALWFLRNIDLAAGRHEVARARYARSFPELMRPDRPEVSADNFMAAVDLAHVLIHLGEKERAEYLLEGSLEVIKTLPRLGTNGYWITDVRILALQQRQQQAIDAGWGFFIWLYLDHDPSLDSIRAEPKFQQLYSDLKDDLAAQAHHVQELKASGDLSSVVVESEK